MCKGARKGGESEGWQVSPQKTQGAVNKIFLSGKGGHTSWKYRRVCRVLQAIWQEAVRQMPSFKGLTLCRRTWHEGEETSKPRGGDWGGGGSLVKWEPLCGPLLVRGHSLENETWQRYIESNFHLSRFFSKMSTGKCLFNTCYKVKVTAKGQRRRHSFNILLQGQSYYQRFFSNGANGISVTLLERLYSFFFCSILRFISYNKWTGSQGPDD